MTTTKMKFQSFLLTTPHVQGMTKALRQAGLTVIKDTDAGTVKALFQDVEVFFAIQKGSGQPWIVRHVVDLFD